MEVDELHPAREGGKRRYAEDVLRRLSVIGVAKRAGFSLAEIRFLVEATDGGAPAHRQLKRLAQGKIAELQGLIAHATEVMGWLERSRECTCDTLDECSLFDQGLPRRCDWLLVGIGCRSQRNSGHRPD